MQDRWERMLNAAERETNTHAFAYERGRQDAMNAPAYPSGRDVEADEGAPATRASGPAGSGPASTSWPGPPPAER